MGLRIACRQSQLAKTQAEIVGNGMLGSFNCFELITCSTLADRKQNSTLADIGGKGLFVKEVELALLESRADLAVHSLKDMPVNQPEGLPIIAVSARESAHDVLIGAKSWQDLPQSALIGTCSPRRSFQIKNLRPDLNVIPLRGNINTRLQKLKDGNVDAIILAEAGIVRAKLDIDYYRFSVEEMLPSAGQGVLAIQIRPGLEINPAAISEVSCERSFAEVMLEREIVKYLGATCHSPLAVYVQQHQSIINVQVKAGCTLTLENIHLVSESPCFKDALEIIKTKIDNSNIRTLLSR